MKTFIRYLSQFIDKSRLIEDQLLCYAYATDASMYRMTPKLVVLVETNDEVQQIIQLANRLSIALTFRAAGTSLSGQAITDSVLVVLSNYAWQNYTIHNNGRQITLEPGIIGATANLYLKSYNTKIGPDPASINSCKIGGIIANNSSGMCCGVAQNTYQTMQSIKLIMANGSKLDTASSDSKNKFAQDNIELINGIKLLYQQVQNDPHLVQLIKSKFKIKNTTGYSLNAFIDYEDPIDILAHLIVGSEGTLGFVSEITYNCVDNNPYAAASLIFCDDLQQIINLSLAFRDIAIDAIELLDLTSLLAVKGAGKNASYLPEVLGEDTSAMLVEISAISDDELTQKINIVEAIIEQHNTVHQIKFTSDNKIRTDLWEMRKGILPLIGSNRLPTSTVIIEDVAVHITDLPQMIKHLRALFIKYNYTNAAIVGHILAGNIHFIFTPCLNTEYEINNYDLFMQDVSNLIAITYQGSLKAEHGCGRNMAAFVELEWGNTAYKLMWQIKSLFDPNNILNPGVILNQDSKIHIKNLKQLHAINPQIDTCIECGFCESVCPSQKLTFSPRQRISAYRYISSLINTNKKLYNKFIKQYKYYAIDTCATTGLCASKCPVSIDTGNFILELKQRPNTLLNNLWIHNFNLFVKFNRRILKIANLMGSIFGRTNTYRLSHNAHKLIPIIPIYPTSMPQTQGATFTNRSSTSAPTIIYIPSCNNRIFADNSVCGSGHSYNAVHRLLERIGYNVIYPKQVLSVCCGQVFDSSGNANLGHDKRLQLVKIIQNSEYPVLIDNSSCVHNILNHTNNSTLTSMLDILEAAIPKFNIRKKYNKLALHIDCSSKKLGQDAQIISVLKHFADEIIIPQGINCCGFAGSKGFTTPKLNEAALSTLAQQITNCDIGVTFNRNCQIGLEQHGKKTYVSLAELVLNCI